MKKIFITFFISITFLLISWKYNEVKFDDPNKDKLLIELLKYVLEKGHYQSQDINDELSKKQNFVLEELNNYKNNYKLLTKVIKKLENYITLLTNKITDIENNNKILTDIIDENK